MNKKEAQRLAKHLAGFRQVGDYSLKRISEKRKYGSEFDEWLEGKESVGAFRVESQSRGEVINVFLCKWRGYNSNDEWYIIIYPKTVSNNPVIEIWEVSENEYVWRYRPSKQDGENEKRKMLFQKHCGSNEVGIPIPASKSDIPSFLELLFSLKEQRDSAHALMDSKKPIVCEFEEGSVVRREHKRIERNAALVRMAKEEALKRHGKLECEVCGFDFGRVYGKNGDGFIEAHHRKPLSELKTKTINTIHDLALVCSNCHSVIHRQMPWITIQELQSKIQR